MKIRRRAVAGLALATLLALAAAGCGDDSADGTSSPISAVATDPEQALADSLTGIAEGNFTFTFVNHESTATGSVHKPSKSARVELKSTAEDAGAAEIDFVIVDKERWTKMDLGPANAELKIPDKWVHLDAAKVATAKALKQIPVDFSSAERLDPAGSALIVKALVSAERAGDGRYSGTVDLTQATDAGAVDEDLVGTLGSKATAVPFTASLDAQGRLTELTLRMPVAGEVAAHEITVKYADYGAATPAEKPAAAETQEATPEIYEILSD